MKFEKSSGKDYISLQKMSPTLQNIKFLLPEKRFGKMYNYNVVYLSDEQRLFPFPYPLKRIGYFPGCFELNEPGQPAKRNFFVPHDQFEITLRLTYPEKRLTQIINGTEYINSFPHVMLKCPGTQFSYVSPCQAMNSLCLTYSKKYFQPIYEQFFQSGPLAWNLNMTDRITNLVHTIIEQISCVQNFSMADRMDLQCFELLEELFLARMQGEKITVRRKPVIDEVAYYLQLNCYRPIDLKSLIESKGMSVSTFFRQWKSHYKETPVNYLNRLRMEEAGRLLLEASHTPSQIAKLLNFSSLSYFYASFKKYYGCSPAAYLRGEQPEKSNGE